MCDYSLGEYRSRLAGADEDLVVHRFLSGTRGLVSPSEASPFRASLRRSLEVWFPRFRRQTSPIAVCVPPGAHLRIAEDCCGYACGADVMMDARTAESYVHRDALRMADGEMVSLQHLPIGLRLHVVALNSSAEEIFGRANGRPEDATSDLLSQIMA